MTVPRANAAGYSEITRGPHLPRAPAKQSGYDYSPGRTRLFERPTQPPPASAFLFNAI